MKKLTSIILILLCLSLTACTSQSSQPNIEGVTQLDAGVWPVNAYTAGLPVPDGTVLWATLDSEHGNCGINLTDISETEHRQYLDLLKQAGFSVIAETTEDIDGQDYASSNILLSNGERRLSISYLPNSCTIYISSAE